MKTQRPFAHQDGSKTPAPAKPVHDLLAPHALASQLANLDSEIASTKSFAGELDDIGSEAYLAAAGLLGDTRGVLLALQAPPVNATVVAMHALPPSEAAIIAQVAVALLDAGSKRPKLILELRAALDRVTP